MYSTTVKIVVCVVLVSAAISEDCQVTSDCNHVTCPERDYVLTCDNRICSCVQSTQHSCLLPTDCQNSAPGSNNFCDRDFHCVDGTCRCGHGFGPAPGGGDHHPGGGQGPVGK
ncbi:serine protease inhibitor Cvsi-1-like isoform X2 [Ruditapes philippinarum]|uniref:serine protease inhibitor Cvsi-1-like isoform X2 n=1 Tax=Ruditapes philippinarum TaxID=129788 RepID=UPI00295BF4A1|nr:serine protease inhibitor Cvsi-1-like isoform X2 [Ruditapes philippinarum]